MKGNFIFLAKNHYDMDGNKGASVLMYGDHEETNNKLGISVTNANISYDEHAKINIFPATYSCDFKFITQKSKNGKEIPTLKLENITLVERLKFISDK